MKGLTWDQFEAVFGRRAVEPGDTLEVNGELMVVSLVTADKVEFVEAPEDDEDDEDGEDGEEEDSEDEEGDDEEGEEGAEEA